MNKESKIYIAGHRGLVGSAIVRNLKLKGYHNLLLRSHAELDLVDQKAVAEFFRQEKPEYVFLAAAKVGGIMANNTYRAQFIYENLQIQNNVIHQSYVNHVHKLLFLGSSCVYPKNAPQPISEDSLLGSELEYTNEPYAIAKIAGMKMCESYNLQYGTNYISVMPTNLYGYNDNYHLENSHVLPALIRKMHLSHCLESGDFNAIRADFSKYRADGVTGNSSDEEIILYLNKKGIFQHVSEANPSVKLELWGSGSPLREFLWSDDMADACVFILENYNFSDLVSGKELNPKSEIRNTHINIGSGLEITIHDLAYLVKEVVGFKGEIVFDKLKPDGTPRKLLNVSKLNNLGWTSKMSLAEGIKKVYKHYIGE